MHLADAFIQSDLQCIQAIHLFCQYVCSWESNPQPLRCMLQRNALTTEPQEHTYIYFKKSNERLRLLEG